MKYLLLLALIVSCGKHDMPVEKDLADNDGDQTPNHLEVSEFERNVADITPFGNVQAEIRFQVGFTGIERNVIELENNMDLSTYSKDLMVKNLTGVQIEDYFSEFSILRVKKNEVKDLGKSETVNIRLLIKNVENATDLSIFHGGEKIKVGSIQGATDISLRKEVLESILMGNSFFALSNENIRMFAHSTQFENIKEKTYRVIMDSGVDTKIYYVAKTYPFKNFLKHFKIKALNKIEKFSLLTTAYASKQHEWWVRTINEVDKVVRYDNLKTLSGHYLESFSRLNRTLKRIDGVSLSPLLLEKNSGARTMFKIRASRSENVFATKVKKETYHNGSPRNGGDKWTCKNSYRSISGSKGVSVTEEMLRNTLKIFYDGIPYSDYSLISGEDASGFFWEVEIPTSAEKVSVSLENVDRKGFIQVGLFDSVCKDAAGETPKVKENLRAFENHLTLEVEAYVENIQE